MLVTTPDDSPIPIILVPFPPMLVTAPDVSHNP